LKFDFRSTTARTIPALDHIGELFQATVLNDYILKFEYQAKTFTAINCHKLPFF
jgi:hypothetical protein